VLNISFVLWQLQSEPYQKQRRHVKERTEYRVEVERNARQPVWAILLSL
jgi:uncharacterized membrane protein